MNKDLQIYRIPHHTDEWFEFRKNGIGGSEVGTVLGINRYDTNVRLFHEVKCAFHYLSGKAMHGVGLDG